MVATQPSRLGSSANQSSVNPQGSQNAGGVKGKVGQFGTYVRNNPLGVRIIGAIGGIGLSVVSILACFAVFNTFLSPITYILNVFYLVFGLAVTAVTILPQSFIAEAIYGQAHFMSTLGGKALFFLYLGALLFGSGLSGSSTSWVYLLIGSWMIFSSGIYLFVKCRGGEGSTTSQSLA
jgi:hypothetical protein